MSETPESNRPIEAASSDATPPVSSHVDLSSEQRLEDHPPGMEEIEREVSEAIGAMDADDLAELCIETSPSRAIDPGPDGDAIAPGTKLTGVIAGVSGDEVFMEFGAKAQGLLPRSQFGKKEPLDVGRQVDVVVERFDAEAGLLIVNRQGAVARATWNTLSVRGVVEGRVTGVIKGGLEVNLQGIRAFMPASQVDVIPRKDISELLNEIVRCEVIDLDRRGKNVVLSRRKVLEREQAEAREKLQSELEAGQTRRGVVGNLTEFGAFVDLGGIDGLIHIRDLSWGTVDNVADVLSPGQEVEVMVLKVDTERNRISLGLKQALPDPWANVAERYSIGTTLKVRIVRIADFGAFAELEPGVEGLIPLSEMSWTRINRTKDAVSVGDMVDAVVIRLDPEKRRLALSTKQAQPDPWDGVLDGFQVESLAKGRVTRLADFGAFVEIAPGVEGLVHISELSDRRVKSCGDVVQVGQEIEARVLGIDKDNHRISLSLKRAAAPEEATDGASPEPSKPRKKRKKPLRGGLASHFEW